LVVLTTQLLPWLQGVVYLSIRDQLNIQQQTTREDWSLTR